MFKLTRRTSAILLVAAASAGVSAAPANANPSAPAPVLTVKESNPILIGLLLPAVQAARQAAR